MSDILISADLPRSSNEIIGGFFEGSSETLGASQPCITLR